MNKRTVTLRVGGKKCTHDLLDALDAAMREEPASNKR
jgi:hypothetical protein